MTASLEFLISNAVTETYRSSARLCRQVLEEQSINNLSATQALEMVAKSFDAAADALPMSPPKDKPC